MVHAGVMRRDAASAYGNSGRIWAFLRSTCAALFRIRPGFHYGKLDNSPISPITQESECNSRESFQALVTEMSCPLWWNSKRTWNRCASFSGTLGSLEAGAKAGQFHSVPGDEHENVDSGNGAGIRGLHDVRRARCPSGRSLVRVHRAERDASFRVHWLYSHRMVVYRAGLRYKHLTFWSRWVIQGVVLSNPSVCSFPLISTALDQAPGPWGSYPILYQYGVDQLHQHRLTFQMTNGNEYHPVKILFLKVFGSHRTAKYCVRLASPL